MAGFHGLLAPGINMAAYFFGPRLGIDLDWPAIESAAVMRYKIS
jgi:hypothetical protein